MIPVTIKNCLPCIALHPYTYQEWLTLPHVVLNSDVDWDPSCLDWLGTVDNKIYHDAQSSIPQNLFDPTFNDYGELRDINKGMHYFDVFEYDYDEDINNVIYTFVEFHKTTHSNNYFDKIFYSCNSFFTFLSSNYRQNNLPLAILPLINRNLTILNCNPIFLVVCWDHQEEFWGYYAIWSHYFVYNP